MENDNIQRKSFLKRFWWIGVVILVLALGLVLAYALNKAESRKIESSPKQNSKANDPYGFAYDSSLPDCPSDLGGLLNHEIFDLTDLDVVVPLGNLSPGVHTIPTDHLYVDHLGKKRMAIYAPGKMTLVSMDDKVTYDSKTDAKIRDDYSMQFALCKGLTIYLNHFSEIEPKVKTAFDNSSQRCETQNKMGYGVDASVMYYLPCQSQFKLPFEAGELIGYVGSFVGGGTGNAAVGIDLGAYNYNSEPLPMAKPERYSEDNLHAFCGLDLFSTELKNTYYSKLGELVEDSVTASINPRVGEPLCGAYNQDVPGTLAGNWFVGDSNQGGVTRTQYQIALANSVANTGIGEISMQGQTELGGNVAVKFEMTHSGTANRQFSEVTPGEQIYCYQSTSPQVNNAKLDKTGKPIVLPTSKYLIQLVDATHLKIEKQTGSCLSASSSGTGPESQWQFTSPYLYER